MIFPSGMTGTIDQISEDKASVEIMAQDGHTHEVVMPIWMIPCLAKEGTEFFIEIDKPIAEERPIPREPVEKSIPNFLFLTG